jgi:uncharacterized protein YqiB (DUF1249 family)
MSENVPEKSNFTIVLTEVTNPTFSVSPHVLPKFFARSYHDSVLVSENTSATEGLSVEYVTIPVALAVSVTSFVP